MSAFLRVLPLLALAACAVPPSEGTGFASRARVSHPEALFDVAPRSDALRANDPRTGEPRGARLCPRPDDLRPFETEFAASLATYAGPGKAGGSKAPRLFGHELSNSAYRTLLDLDMTRARRDIDMLRAHAAANAWLPREGSWSSAASVIEGMGTLLPSWQILRQTSAATDEDRAAIDGWLTRLAAHAATHPGGNNIGTQRGTNDMLFGLMTGDQGRYARGLAEAYAGQLKAMRPDGSFPLEADRGRKALENTSRNIGLMVYAARIAQSQGTDLYATEIDGKSLTDAVDFFLRASADNGLVDVYARANRNPAKGFEAFAPNAQVTGFNSNSRGWIKLYTDRFPGTPTSKALLGNIELARRVSSDTAGGWVSCYASRL